MIAALLLTTAALAADVAVTPVEGRPFAARLVRIADGAAVFQSGEGERKIARDELVQWGAVPDAERGAQVVLADGSILVGDVLGIDDKELRLGDATGLGRGWWQEVKLSLTLVRGVILQPSGDPGRRDRQRRQAADGTRVQDELVLVDGRSLAGLLLPSARNDAGMSAIRWQVRGLSKPAEVPLAKVAAMNLANLTGEKLVPKACWTLALDDGTRLVAAELRGTSLELACGIKLAPTLDDPADESPFWNSVRYLAGESSRVQYLSAEAPQKYLHRPLLTGERPLGRDVNAFGGALRTADGIVLRGLGTHAASEATYVVPKGAKRFEAEGGIDRSAGERGSVIFAVLLERDGAWKEAFTSEIVRGGDAPVRISVILDGAERVQLETRSADRGDEGDRANWGSARWILGRSL